MHQNIHFNPITNIVTKAIDNSQNELSIAVPFISGFAKKILSPERLQNIASKKIVTRFNEHNLNTFDLPTLKYLIENKVEIRYRNDIHLKTYLFDNQGFISSSNLTKSGFENNVEITSTISKENIATCKTFFNDLWESSEELNIEIIEANWTKYLLLRNRTNFTNSKSSPKTRTEITSFDLDIQKIIPAVLEHNLYWDWQKNAYPVANSKRKEFISRITNNYKPSFIYSAPYTETRHSSLAYLIGYDIESQLAGTGLHEGQLRMVLSHPDIDEIISYIYPPAIGGKPWDLNQKDQYLALCNGIFSYTYISNYKEVMPIRLVSYFYPDHFLPIFKIDDLHQISNFLGFSVTEGTIGDKLAEYNIFLIDILSDIPYKSTYLKSNYAYQFFFLKQLIQANQTGKSVDDLIANTKEKWRKDYLKRAHEILSKLNSET